MNKPMQLIISIPPSMLDKDHKQRQELSFFHRTCTVHYARLNYKPK